ncbi:Transposase [Minicystis rosea]|nr:Transposase [Minicystis rosea]
MRRHLLFRPDARINQLLTYALAVSAHRLGLQVHAFCAMSTHLHLVVTDVHGLLPRFLQFFHRLVALGTKLLRRWEGPVWDHEATSVVRLLTRAAIVEKIAYVLANPVAAGLVRHAREWPGAMVGSSEVGTGVLRASRPQTYFDPSNPQWPAEVSLPILLPPSIERSGADPFRAEVAAEVERLEQEAHAEMRRKGLRFLGPERVRKISPQDRISSFEPARDRNPTFAVGREQGGAWHRAVEAVRSFRMSYRAAIERWRAGLRSVAFPSGTWWMRVFHGADVAEPSSCSAGGLLPTCIVG